MLQKNFFVRNVVGSVLILVSSLSLTTIVGCFGGKSDSDSANVAVSSPAVDRTVSDALQELQRLTMLNKSKNATICFIGVSGSAPQTSTSGLSAETRRQFESRSSFRVLERSSVENALKESGVRANNLFIPAERKKFIEALGEPVDYLLAGRIERSKTNDDSDDDSTSKSGAPVFKLEMVDLATNKKFEYVGDL